MEDLNNNTTPQAPKEMPEEVITEKKSGGMGPLIGVVIIVVILALGGLYVWGGQLNKEGNGAAPEAATIQITTPSDEPAAIDNSLDEFDTDTFESDLNADLEALELEF